MQVYRLQDCTYPQETKETCIFYLLLGQVYLCAQLAISDLPNDWKILIRLYTADLACKEVTFPCNNKTHTHTHTRYIYNQLKALNQLWNCSNILPSLILPAYTYLLAIFLIFSKWLIEGDIKAQVCTQCNYVPLFPAALCHGPAGDPFNTPLHIWQQATPPSIQHMALLTCPTNQVFVPLMVIVWQNSIWTN